jgi:Tol biopolymer transport system component
MKRIRPFSVLLPVLAAGVAPAGVLAQQDPLSALYDSAYVNWQDGAYPDALAQLERLLQAPGGDRFLEPVALLTGELYHARQIAPDGRNIRFGPDGRFLAYETGTRSDVRTHIVDISDEVPRAVAEVAGAGLVFSPDGRRVAYIAPPAQPSTALKAAYDDFQRLRAARVDQQELIRRARAIAVLEALESRVMMRDLESGRERAVEAGEDLAKLEIAFSADGEGLYLTAYPRGQTDRTVVVELREGRPRAELVAGPDVYSSVVAIPGGRHLAYTVGRGTIAVRDLSTGATRTFHGTQPALSADGSTLVFVAEENGENTVNVVSLRDDTDAPVVVERTRNPVAAPALSPDGGLVAYQMMPREDWELYVVARDGTGKRRLTHEIQHDVAPRFLDSRRVLALIGEPRHRRSYLYDVETGERTRLHHNNTVRTVAPEYEWAASPDGSKVVIVADRDGNTISPERSVWLLDLDRKVTRDEVLARIRANLAHERDLRERGERMFAPIAEEVRAAVRDVSATRIYGYASDVFRFGSKHITQPGNQKAIEYYAEKLREFGYEPELQWFEPRPGIRTANVIATLRGTVDPDLVYVVSSHFDSVERGPGADDNSSGATALLEAARVLASRPQARTIKFAFFTGEEAGLLGSREFVRRAAEEGMKVVGALNNDMIGYANDVRLDNTIRYSNHGLRDLQHAAAFLFTDLITYDAEYYRGTDAAAFYEAWGDIVGGIGSYPILGNPHYHQEHDVLETIDQRLVAEVSKTTVASIMLMASSPSRLTGLQVTRQGQDVDVSWTPAAESDVRSYVVTYRTPGGESRTTVVRDARVRLPGVPPDSEIVVKAVNQRGLESWDGARAAAP